MRVTVRVPATSANVGPGFDCFGLALDLCNEFTVDTDAGPAVTWEGLGADELPTDGSDMVSRAMRHAAGSATSALALPPFHLHGVNRVPLERGLGSSATAAVAGVVLAAELLGLDDLREPGSVLSVASGFEGHGDNVAASVLGGFTIHAGGSSVRLDPHPSIRPVVLVPEQRLSTEAARAAIPREVPLADAVTNVGNAATMVHAITADPSLLPSAVGDRLHQAYRLALVPEVLGVFERVAGIPVPVCVSGAGPSLLALEVDDGPAVHDPGDGWTVLRPGVRTIGYDVAVEA